MTVSFQVKTALEKMDSTDSDYRYMAASDLYAQLQSPNFKVEHEVQKKLCRALLKLLKDTNSEVQGIAIKCLPLFAGITELQHTLYIVEKLVDHLLMRAVTPGNPDNTSTKAMRDVSALVLKAILAHLDPSGHKAAYLAPSIIPKLSKFVSSTRAVDDDANILIESLEVLYELLNRLGSLVSDLHVQLSEAFFFQLTAPNQLVRKRAIASLSAIAAVCDAALFRRITDKLIFDLQQPVPVETRRSTVLAIRAVSKTAGQRLKKNVAVLAPLIFKFMVPQPDVQDDDLLEYCLQVIESFCLRSKREMIPFSADVVKHVKVLAKYDPNYADDYDDDNEGEQDNNDMNEEDEDDMYDEDDYSDDDDMSWKVRRAAIKCLHASITSQLCPPEQLCGDFGLFLVSRFREREEQVQLDVFAAFLDLLRVCSAHTADGAPSVRTGEDNSGGDAMLVDQSDATTSSILVPLVSRTPQVLRSIRKELKSRSPKTRIEAVIVSRELVHALPSLAEPLMAEVVQDLISCLVDPSTTLKTETLLLLKQVVTGGGASALKNYVQAVIPRVLSAADDRYYKVTAECLRFSSATVFAFGTADEFKSVFTALAPMIHDAAVKRVIAQDQDSEVKVAAMQCLGGTVSKFGSSLGQERLSQVSGVLMDRINNEVTRLEAVRAMHLIASSESAELLSPRLSQLTTTLSSFLRKNIPPLKMAALELLCVIPNIPSESVADLVMNTSELIVETDLRVTSLALKLSSNIVKSKGATVVQQMANENGIYHRALQLSSSSMLHGRAVASLLGLLRSFTEVNADPITVQRMLTDLKDSTSQLTVKFAPSVPSKLYCIAKCVFVICSASEPPIRDKIVQDIIDMVNSESLSSRVFSVACLGELGRNSLFPRGSVQSDTVQKAILSALDAEQEEVKTAAALSLGCLSAGNGGSGIPGLMHLIKEQPRQRYLLLLSLKEAIASSTAEEIEPHVSQLVPFLFEFADTSDNGDTSAVTSQQDRSRASEKESVRTAAADCFGRLAQLSPVTVEALASGTKSQSAEVRKIVTGALKSAISTSPDNSVALFESIRPYIGMFVDVIADSDVIAAKNAVQIVNALAKSRPSLLVSNLPKATQLIYARTPKDKSLIRVVDLGPFKHEEDYGLDLRKAAFDCIRTLITGPLCSSISLTTMLENVVSGLRDHSDIRAIAHLILSVSTLTESSSQMVVVIDPIIKALDETFKEKVKDNAVRQEIERHRDCINAALRAVRMMEGVPEIAANRNFKSFLSTVVRSQYAEKYDAIGLGDIEFLASGSFHGVDRVSWSNSTKA